MGTVLAATGMSQSLITAAKKMSLNRVGLVVAGSKESGEALAKWLSEQGIEVVQVAAMGIRDEAHMARATTAQIQQACTAVSGDVDGVIIGSRTIRTCANGILPEIEAAVGKPVISAMQAFIWDIMGLVGVHLEDCEGRGALMGLAH